MTWETRERGGTYYTRTHRVAGRRYREYVGAAGTPQAELAAAEDALHREARERAAQDRRTERERLAALEAPILAVEAIGEAVLGATLVAAGYRQHNRLEWRRWRQWPGPGRTGEYVPTTT